MNEQWQLKGKGEIAPLNRLERENPNPGQPKSYNLDPEGPGYQPIQDKGAKGFWAMIGEQISKSFKTAVKNQASVNSHFMGDNAQSGIGNLTAPIFGSLSTMGMERGEGGNMNAELINAIAQMRGR